MDIPQVIHCDEATIGDTGQQYLATGKNVGLRRWSELPGDSSRETCRSYEAVGYLVSGKMEFTLDGTKVVLVGGDSWLVPAGAVHSYCILEPIVAIEATSPPGQFNDQDEYR